MKAVIGGILYKIKKIPVLVNRNRKKRLIFEGSVNFSLPMYFLNYQF
jgi:hypothetical protein